MLCIRLLSTAIRTPGFDRAVPVERITAWSLPGHSVAESYFDWRYAWRGRLKPLPYDASAAADRVSVVQATHLELLEFSGSLGLLVIPRAGLRSLLVKASSSSATQKSSSIAARFPVSSLNILVSLCQGPV